MKRLNNGKVIIESGALISGLKLQKNPQKQN
jgi:hypothetical protein